MHTRSQMLLSFSGHFFPPLHNAELKIAAGHWPFSVQFSTMATQKLTIIALNIQMPNNNFSLASQTQSLIFRMHALDILEKSR